MIEVHHQIMANEEHKQLASVLKDVHSSLRKSSAKLGDKEAWRQHCSNHEILKQYAECMEKLATTYWEASCSNLTSPASSRIEWTANVCREYFVNKYYNEYRCKELSVAEKINVVIPENVIFSDKIKLIDVGSCYNPFKIYDFMEVFAIDLCPANDSVFQCDFLNVDVGDLTVITENKVKQLEKQSFETVSFCFLLEYIPSSELRLKACETAYSILKPGGLLIITTPDSKHVGANCKIMKCWRYSLSHIGFTRIKYTKYTHMHCMAFRKALNKLTAVRWGTLHKEPYMEYSMNIPQDFFKEKQEYKPSNQIEFSLEDFSEMPFSDVMDNHK